MSDTSNESRNDVSQTDNRRVIGEGGVSAEGGSNVSIVSNVVDGGAFGFGKAALDFGSEALNVNSSVLRAALTAMGNTSDNAMATATAAQQSTLSAARSAMDANADVLNAAFNQSDRAFSKAYDAIAGAGNMVATAYEDAKGRGSQTDTMIMLAIGAMAVVAYFAVAKK